MNGIKTEVQEKRVRYTWSDRLLGLRGNSLSFSFEFDISGVPEHVFNFIFGVFLMDSLVLTGKEIFFSELTKEEGYHLRRILRSNFESKGCAGRAPGPCYPQVYAPEARASSLSKGNRVVCANGLGKDGLNVALLTKEMGYSPLCYTILNQYWNRREVWEERLRTIKGFYQDEGIDHTFIESNFFRITSSPIGFYPYVVGLVLAYVAGTNVILDGIQIHNNKTRLSDGTFYCPGETYKVFNHVSEATGVIVSSPLRPLSNYGSQKLLAERWPDYLMYQRSCMYGLPWCGKCSKCNRKALYLEEMGVDPGSILLPRYSYEKLRLDQYGPVCGSVLQVLAKHKGISYRTWIDGANDHALRLIWNGDKLREIFSEHFHVYDEDPGPDGEGYTLNPSRWETVTGGKEN